MLQTWDSKFKKQSDHSNVFHSSWLNGLVLVLNSRLSIVLTCYTEYLLTYLFAWHTKRRPSVHHKIMRDVPVLTERTILSYEVLFSGFRLTVWFDEVWPCLFCTVTAGHALVEHKHPAPALCRDTLNMFTVLSSSECRSCYWFWRDFICLLVLMKEFYLCATEKRQRVFILSSSAVWCCVLSSWCILKHLYYFTKSTCLNKHNFHF